MSRPRRPEISLVRLRQFLNLHQRRAFLVISIGTGALAGFTAVLYHIFLEYLFHHLFARVNLFSHRDWRVVAIVTAGGVVAALILNLLPEARGSGVAHTKIAVVARDGYIPLRSTLGKFFASGIGIGSGQSMGPEGPALHIGAGIASLIGRLTSQPKERLQQLVPIGAAAGLAAVFNAPITAVLFTLEEIVGDLNTPLLGSTVVAAVVAVIVSRWFLGPGPLFHVPTFETGGPSELIIFAVLGVVGGVLSVAFTEGLLRGRARLLRTRPILRRWLPVSGAFVVGVMALAFPQILSVGYDTVNTVLDGHMLLGVMLWLALFKIVATGVCYATGNAGGVFAPSLYMGAMVGGSVGAIAHTLFPASQLSSVGAYALIGMGTMFAGINRTPMTSIFMIFEVTLDYNLILPLMVANMTAYVIAVRMQHEGIYEALARQDGIVLPTHRSEGVLRQLTNADAVPGSFIAFSAQESVRDVAARVQDSTQPVFPVMDRDRFAGTVAAARITEAIASHREEVTMGELSEWDAEILVYPDQSLYQSLQLLGQGHPALAVVSRLDSRELVGIITTPDVMRALGFASGAQPAEPSHVEAKL